MSRKTRRINQYNVLKELHVALEGCCYLCGCKLDVFEMTKDHVFPRSFGYAIIKNAMPAHQECNLNKGDRLPTTKEIELSCIAYEQIGSIFDPRNINDGKLVSKPIEFFIWSMTQNEAA